ncbi:MAG TPA: carboxypeptidase-like regulatory domain-containing protein [Blastocatellia bacterium]|nr:carboxypeptidase-like regulatory domain-containing protein [Blastocatellia bacterium]
MKVRFGVALYASVVVLGFSLLTTPTFAQGYGRISGVLVDPQYNAVVVRGRVTVAYEKRKYVTYSDDFGRFHFDISKGSYTLSVQSRGFVAYVVEGIKVRPGSKTDLSVSLMVHPFFSEPPIIEQAVPPIEKIDATLSEKIPPRKIH